MKIRIIALVILGILAIGQKATAADTIDWKSDEERLPSLQCQQQWDILWSWAKKGNLEARARIFFLLAPPVDGDRILMPGRGEDSITQIRDLIIMAVHSTGVSFPEEKYNQSYKETAAEFYSTLPIKELNGNQFLSCLSKSAAPECTAIAVKDKIVPSFQDYAQEVDAVLAQGRTATCLPARAE